MNILIDADDDVELDTLSEGDIIIIDDEPDNVYVLLDTKTRRVSQIHPKPEPESRYKAVPLSSRVYLVDIDEVNITTML